MRKKYLITSVLFFLFSIQINAQQSLGFSEPDDFKYLLGYQLPDWGYQNFYLSSIGLNSSGAYRFYDFDSSDPLLNNFYANPSNHSLSIGINPGFEKYKEGEKKITFLSINTRFTTGFFRSTANEQNGDTSIDRDRKNNDQDFNFDIRFRNNSYIDKNLFLISNLNADISYLRGYSKNEINASTTNDQTNTARFITFNPALGIGYGRIRNITPMIRALRLNERYKALGNSSFSGNEIKSSADIFTKVQGYQRTEDRFLKEFWGDINSGVNYKLDALNTFDLFYLNDIFDENLGNRFEGFEIYLIADYNYLNTLRKENDRFNDFEDRDFAISREANLSLNFEWFKNLDLYNQISVIATNEFIFPLERENDENFGNLISLNSEWLWNFTDRFQLTTSLLNNWLKVNFKDERADDFVEFNSRLTTNLFYFIESKLALNAGVSINFRKLDRGFDSFTLTDQQFSWTLNAGISYYFNRKLY